MEGGPPSSTSRHRAPGSASNSRAWPRHSSSSRCSPGSPALAGQEPAANPGGPGVHVDSGSRHRRRDQGVNELPTSSSPLASRRPRSRRDRRALLASFVTRVIPERWDLFLSVQFIAIILIGGAGTVAGVILGSAFVVLLPRVVQDFTLWLQSVALEGRGDRIGDRQRLRRDHPQRLRAGQHLCRGRAGLIGGPVEPRPIRSADHRLSHLRAARLVRYLASHPQLLEGLAVHLLSGHERASRPTRNRGGRNE